MHSLPFSEAGSARGSGERSRPLQLGGGSTLLLCMAALWSSCHVKQKQAGVYGTVKAGERTGSARGSRLTCL